MSGDNYGAGFSSGAQGAMAGFTVGGPLGAGIGGGIGLLTGLFSDSPEEIARQRWEAFKKSLQDMKANTIRTGTQQIGQQTAANVADATIGGKRRAIASGRDYQAESYILPGVGQAENTGAKALTSFLTDTNRTFDNALIQGEENQMNLPIPKQANDYFDVVAGGVGQFMRNKNQYDMLEKYIKNQGTTNWA